ncbi:HipA domain-containing protein, partial [Thiomicrospira sp.]|uniref:HipA domain-containing protein n=1 Tax=Thiomicrospira sp. TaxID=935 RepID=UPI0025E85DF6
MEITRFDRHGEYGRKGIISLKSLDAQFVGKGTDWPRVAKALLNEQQIKAEDDALVETAYAFGQLIANSDMHLGNFSFFSDGLHILNPTPIYDMLPMAFMPRKGELITPDFQIPRFIDVSEPAKHQAKIAALDFWQTVIDHP